MATKDLCLALKDKQNIFTTVSDRQYSNLNLNQNNFCVFDETSSLKRSTSDNSKNVQDYAKQDSWNNKSNKHLSPNFLNVNNDFEKQDEFKQSKSFNFNNSTLSLHIEAYENLLEADSDSDSGEEEETSKMKGEKLETAKHFVSDSSSKIENQFEFPRQQKDGLYEPQMMQFKATQKLLNPNQLVGVAAQQPHMENAQKPLAGFIQKPPPVGFNQQPSIGFKGSMILPRLKPSTALPFVRSLTTSNYRCASQGKTTQLFKDINRLAREGKWDAINNAPKAFMFGHAREEANAVYAKVIQPEDSFAKYGGQPYGPWIFLATRVAGYFAGLFIICKAYELVVPEQYRLHYKYRPKKHDHHHEDAGHH
uniref:Uncharacterized protein n=1 Tax=Panagrolaimus sp. ES5 TaxID=591445 RepID=A0AC34FIK9_9BILA